MHTTMELIRTINEAKLGNLPEKLIKKMPLISNTISNCLSKDPNLRPTLEKIGEDINK